MPNMSEHENWVEKLRFWDWKTATNEMFWLLTPKVKQATECTESFKPTTYISWCEEKFSPTEKQALAQLRLSGGGSS